MEIFDKHSHEGQYIVEQFTDCCTRLQKVYHELQEIDNKMGELHRETAILMGTIPDDIDTVRCSLLYILVDFDDDVLKAIDAHKR